MKNGLITILFLCSVLGVTVLFALSLVGCASTPEQKQALSQSLRDINSNMQRDLDRQNARAAEYNANHIYKKRQTVYDNSGREVGYIQ